MKRCTSESRRIYISLMGIGDFFHEFDVIRSKLDKLMMYQIGVAIAWKLLKNLILVAK